MAAEISIEVVYGDPNKQELVALTVAQGCSVQQAIEKSGILQRWQEIDLNVNAVGVWNRTCKLSETLKDNDRIEIYRPLIADPKEVRRRRAEKAIQEGRADKVTGGRPSNLRKGE